MNLNSPIALYLCILVRRQHAHICTTTSTLTGGVFKSHLFLPKALQNTLRSHRFEYISSHYIKIIKAYFIKQNKDLLGCASCAFKALLHRCMNNLLFVYKHFHVCGEDF